MSGNSTVGTITKGGGSIYCIYNVGGASTGGTEVMTNNNFSNITWAAVANSSSQYGIYSNTYAAHTKVISNNTISNISNPSGTGSVYCFYGLASIPNQVNGNTAYNITHGGGTIYGVYTSGTATIYDNSIHDVTTLGSIYGMYISGGDAIAYRNHYLWIDKHNCS